MHEVCQEPLGVFGNSHALSQKNKNKMTRSPQVIVLVRHKAMLVFAIVLVPVIVIFELQAVIFVLSLEPVIRVRMVLLFSTLLYCKTTIVDHPTFGKSYISSRISCYYVQIATW